MAQMITNLFWYIELQQTVTFVFRAFASNIYLSIDQSGKLISWKSKVLYFMGRFWLSNLSGNKNVALDDPNDNIYVSDIAIASSVVCSAGQSLGI